MKTSSRRKCGLRADWQSATRFGQVSKQWWLGDRLNRRRQPFHGCVSPDSAHLSSKNPPNLVLITWSQMEPSCENQSLLRFASRGLTRISQFWLQYVPRSHALRHHLCMATDERARGEGIVGGCGADATGGFRDTSSKSKEGTT